VRKISEPDNFNYGVWHSFDKGDNWTQLIAPDAESTVVVTNCAILDTNTYVLWGGKKLMVSYDQGATWQDKSGNIASLISGSILNIVGLG
jgi:hypothetical protein